MTDYNNTLVSDEQMSAIQGFVSNLTTRAKEPIDDDVRAAYQRLHDWVEENGDGRYSSVAYQILALAMEDALGTGAPDVMFPESVSHKFVRMEMDLKLLRDRLK